MKQFEVEDDLVELVWQLANPAPFENLTFSGALRRVLGTHTPSIKERVSEERVNEMLAELAAMPDDEFAAKHPNYEKPRPRLRASSPKPQRWLASVPELSSVHELRTWRSICDYLNIAVGGDSARRKLADWVASHRPNWPPVPTPDE